MDNIYTGRYYDQFAEGEVILSPARTITEADITAYAGLSGDFNPLHMDAVFCAKLPQGQRIAHGGLTFVISAGIFNRYVDGTCIAFLGLEFRYTRMVMAGDTLRLRITVQSKKLTSKGKGVVAFGIETLNQRDEAVLEGVWTLLLEPGLAAVG